jgi:hypothetical protein
MAKRRFTRAQPDEVVTLRGALYNRLVETLEWLTGLTVATPLELHEGPGGPVIGARIPPPGDNWVWVKATSATLNTVPLGGGKYAGRMMTGTSTVAANATNLTMPEGLTTPGADDCMIANVAESGTTSHALTHADANTSFVLGYLSGETVTANGATYPVVWVDVHRAKSC